MSRENVTFFFHIIMSRFVTFILKNLSLFLSEHCYRKHLQYCRDTTVMTYKQVAYKKIDQSARKELVDEKILPNEDFHNEYFVAFDIGE